MIVEASILIFLVLLAPTLAHSDVKINNHHTENPVVTTSLGQIRGSILTTRLGKPIYSFRGIRYAIAPIGELRFQPPQPVLQWKGIYDATKDGPVCPQPTNDPVSEDCLLLNVYTTKLSDGVETFKRPVIVYIHAGGFYSVTGRSNWAGPQYFLDQDIVLVTINYRLGSLGFLSTGDKEAPGNNGLKDQVEALKWVKNYILPFGGDPNSVTILGYSAGGMSVTLHLISPLSKGLFHRAVAMSGSSLGNWPIKHNQIDLARKQARLLGCPDDNSANIIKCLKTKSALKIGETLSQFAEFGTDPVLIWTPVIEKDFGQQRFLTEHPITSVIDRRFQEIPLITGITRDEFGYKSFGVLADPELVRKLNQEWDKYAPIAFIYDRDSEKSKNISNGLRQFYFGGNPVDNSTFTHLAHLYADSVTGFGVNRAAKLISCKNTQPIYYYLFSAEGRYSHFYLPNSNGTVPYGVVHHDDLIYLFYISEIFPKFKEGDPEVTTVEKLTTLYANFARTGKPIPEPSRKLDDVVWESYNVNSQKYLEIGNKLAVRERLYSKRYDEWEKLFPLSQYETAHTG